MFKKSIIVSLFLLAANIAVEAKGMQFDRNSLLERARVCERVGDLEQANSLYTQVISAEPKNCEALEKRANNSLILGHYQKALNDLNLAITFCRRADLYCRRSETFAALDRYELALADLKHCSEANRTLYHTEYQHLPAAIIELLAGRYKEACVDADIHLKLLPQSIYSFELASTADALVSRTSDAMNNLALYVYAKRRSGSESQANPKDWPLTRMHTAEELKAPQYVAQFKHWSTERFRQGAVNDSERRLMLAHLNRSQTGFSQAQLHFAKAIIYFYQRQYDHCMTEAKFCTSSNFKFDADLLRFYCLVMKQSLPSALQQLNLLVSAHPDSQPVLDALDLYYFAAGDRQGAIAEIKSLLAKSPKNVAALVELAKIYRDHSEAKESLKYCQQALALKPRDADILLLKTSILTSDQNYAEALKSVSKVIAVDQKNGAAYIARASIYIQDAKMVDAINDLTQAIKLDYNLIKAYEARAACYGALKRYDMVRKDLDAIKSIDPRAKIENLEILQNQSSR